MLPTHSMSEYAIVEERDYAHNTTVGMTYVKRVFRLLSHLLSSYDQVQ